MDFLQSITLFYYINGIALIRADKQEVANMLNAWIRHTCSSGDTSWHISKILGKQGSETFQNIFSKLKDKLFCLVLHFTKKEAQTLVTLFGDIPFGEYLTSGQILHTEE